MDPLEYLHVRFHYNGEFLRGDKTLTYAGGTVASSFIKRDNLSSLELTAHLKNHLPTYNEGQLLYWHYPERQLFDGLKTLVDDAGCKEISDYITDDGVAEIFVEPVMSVSEDTDGSNYEDETIVCTKDARRKEVSVIVNEKANKKGKNIIESSCSFPAPGCSKKQLDIYLAKERGFVADGDGSSSDSEYMPGDNEASDEDDEAIAIKKQFKEFNYHKAKLAQKTVDGAKAIMKTDPVHWCRAWFRLGSNCDSVDNNICESFNNWIVGARYLPIISMLEVIRRKVMVRIQQQRSKSVRWNQDICPNVFKKIKTWIVQSGNCHAVWNGKDGYEVKYFGHGYTVNLTEQTCSCRYWQLSGLPCPHALPCIFYSGESVDTYIEKCYTVECFKRIYDHCLEPIEGMPSWPISARPRPLPPMYGVMPGRPSGERRREPHEKPKISKASKMSRTGTKIRCSRCKEYGHNKKTCEEKMAAAASTMVKPSAYVTQDKAMGSEHTGPAKRKRAATSSLQIGPASINLNAHDQSSQASSSVMNMDSGRASTNALEPSKQIKRKPVPLLLLED